MAMPLVGLTDAPVIVTVCTRAVTLVPEGTVSAMVLAASLTVPTTAGLNALKLKAVMALAGLAAVTVNALLLLPLPPPVMVTVTSLAVVAAEPDIVTFAVNCVVLPKVTLFTVIAVPLKATVEGSVKLVPVMLIAKV